MAKAAKKAVSFTQTSLDNIDDKKLNAIVDKVMKSKQGASAMKSMMRSVVRSALKSTVKSTMKSPVRKTAAKSTKK